MWFLGSLWSWLIEFAVSKKAIKEKSCRRGLDNIPSWNSKGNYRWRSGSWLTAQARRRWRYDLVELGWEACGIFRLVIVSRLLSLITKILSKWLPLLNPNYVILDLRLVMNGSMEVRRFYSPELESALIGILARPDLSVIPVKRDKPDFRCFLK